MALSRNELEQHWAKLTQRERWIVLAAMPLVLAMLLYGLTAPLLREHTESRARLDKAVSNYLWFRHQAPLLQQSTTNCPASGFVRNQTQMLRYFRSKGLSVDIDTKVDSKRWRLNLENVDDTRIFSILAGITCQGLVLQELELVSTEQKGRAKGSFMILLAGAE